MTINIIKKTNLFLLELIFLCKILKTNDKRGWVDKSIFLIEAIICRWMAVVLGVNL